MGKAGMRPSQVSESLRKIADHVEATERPSLRDASRALSAVLAAVEPEPGTWTITLNDWSSGDITVISPDGSEVSVSGDDAAVEALREASGDDNVRLVRDYPPYGETSMSVSEVRAAGDSGLWGFEGAEQGGGDSELFRDLSLIEPKRVDVREYQPVGPDSPYAVIEGDFEFELPTGQDCSFRGRMDKDSVDGKFTCDGENVTAQVIEGDTPFLGVLDERLDYDLESVLTHLIKESEESYHDALDPTLQR